MATRAAEWATYVVALVPLALAALIGGVGPAARDVRELTLGVTLGGDHAGAAPVAQWFAGWTTLLPLGDLRLRAALGLAIPASIAAAMLARRGRRHPSGARGGAADAMAIGLGALGGAVLARVGTGAALVAIAIELSLWAIVAGAAERDRALAWATAALPLAAWASPRLGWIALVPLAIAVVRSRSPRGLEPLARGAALAAPILAAGIAWVAIRGAVATTVLGRALRDGTWAPEAGELLAAGAPARVALVVAVLAALALLGSLSVGRVAPEDRAAGLTATLAVGAALVLHAQDAVAIAVVALVPVAGATLGALHLAVDRRVGRELARRGTTALRLAAWLVPALALGAAARAFEDDLRERLRSNEQASAEAMASLTTVGVAPPHAILVVEDEPRLVHRLLDAAELGLRPDVRTLPVQGLLLGGATRIAARTIDDAPGAADLLRGLIAHGAIEEPDASPVTARAAILAAIPAGRLTPIARHVEASGGPLIVSLERVDPSERRSHLVALERRLRFVIEGLSSLDRDEPTRAALRTDAMRETRVLSAAGDREAAVAAIHRAEALGAEPLRSERWAARLRAKLSIEAEPATTDD